MAVRYQAGKAVQVAKPSRINLKRSMASMADASIQLREQIAIAKSEGDPQYAAGLQRGWDLLDKARSAVLQTMMNA